LGCGGDGLIHEMLNGFKLRNDVMGDVNSPLKLRSASLLCGSAGSVASFMIIRWKLDRKLYFNSVFCLSRVSFVQAKTMIYETNGPISLIYGYHTMSTGFIADAVSNSSWMRFLGEKRYTLGMLREIIRNKKVDSE